MSTTRPRRGINRGIVIKGKDMDESEGKRTRGAGWKDIYTTLRNEILSLVLKPGQLLDEMSIAERFDMSRSPVREALIRLASDELVVTLSNRSTWHVTSSSFSMIFSSC